MCTSAMDCPLRAASTSFLDLDARHLAARQADTPWCDVEQFRSISGGPFRRSRHDQYRHRPPGKGIFHRGISNGVQVNSVLPRPVMTGRQLHNMTVEEVKANLPKQARIYRNPEEIAELMASLVSPGVVDDRLDAVHGRWRGEVDLT
jgi:hypothetical protein